MSETPNPTPGPGDGDPIREAERQRALTRAAQSLNASLDLDVVLERISREAVAILAADIGGIYRGTASEGATLVTAHGLPPEVIGYRFPPGAGLCGQVLHSAKTVFTNDYPAEVEPPPSSPFGRVKAAVAVPMAWGGQPRGVLSVGFERPHAIQPEEVALLETFAELGAVACNNASAHAGLAEAARTDSLTGCLNAAALTEGLRREIERSRRGLSAPPSLALFDLDNFKHVNDRHGRVLGDEVLRRVGHALRTGTREYDLAARYGGDRFALICVEATEREAMEIARRALERLAHAIGDLGGVGAGMATAGVAEWQDEMRPTELIAHADRALVHGKQQGGRGDAHGYSELPDWFRPARFGRKRPRPAPSTPPPSVGTSPAWPEGAGEPVERLRERARALATAVDLGVRLAVLLDERAVCEAAAGALAGLFGWHGAALTPAGAARPVTAAGERAGHALQAPVPSTTGTESWGVVEVWGPEAPTDDDVLLLGTLATQVGAALEAARRHRAALGDR